jgi:hypothetical protein
LVRAYRLGEEAQWLGTIVDETTARQAREAELKAATGDPLVVDWQIPLKTGEPEIRGVINWPASHRNNFRITLPISAQEFYSPFEVYFGPFENLPPNARDKYENTARFVNAMLSSPKS